MHQSPWPICIHAHTHIYIYSWPSWGTLVRGSIYQCRGAESTPNIRYNKFRCNSTGTRSSAYYTANAITTHGGAGFDKSIIAMAAHFSTRRNSRHAPTRRGCAISIVEIKSLTRLVKKKKKRKNDSLSLSFSPFSPPPFAFFFLPFFLHFSSGHSWELDHAALGTRSVSPVHRA